MILKKTAILIIASIFCLNLMAADEVANEAADQCEATYSACLTVCDADGKSDVEKCYDKCDATYSACLEKLESK
jgi:hypothetical protein